MALDYARRPQFNRHKDGGIFIVSYPDAPGDYFDEAGNPVSDELAAEAGYNVAVDRVERDKRNQIRQAQLEAEAQAAAKIAQIKAASAGGESFVKVLGAARQEDGSYTLADTHGTVLKTGVPFDEAVAALATAHAIDASILPVVEPEIRANGSPTGKFRVVVGGAPVEEKLGRAEAEAIALQRVGG